MRNYSSIASEKTLADPLTSFGSTVQLSDVNGFPAVPFTLVLEPDTTREEIVTVTAIDGTQVTISRGEEGTIAVAHDEGTTVRHMITGRDLQDAQNHIESTENVHGIGDTSFLATLNATQTLINKTLNSPRINEATILSATSTELNKLAGSTFTAAELNYVTGVTAAIQTQINNVIASLSSAVPTGTLSMFAGSSAPTGYLICDGSEVSRTTYSALWDVLRAGTSSSPYGDGNGTTTFRLPDLRGRAPIGVGTGTGLTARNRGATTGTETHTLTTAQMPVHNHSSLIFGSGSGTSGLGGTTIANTQTFTGNAGGGEAHPNMQPSLAVNFIIKH